MTRDLDQAIREVGHASNRYHRRWATYWKAYDTPETKAFWEAYAQDSSFTAADFEADSLERARWALDDMRRWLKLMEDEYEKRDKGRRRSETVRKLENTSGRTPEEAELFRRKARQLRAEDERA